MTSITSINRLQTISNTAILVVSCDAYQDLWNPFFNCFFKYWPDCPYPLYLGTNSVKYPDNRVQSILVGEDLDYSSNLLSMLEHVKEDWIVFWIEDRVLSAPVNTNRVTQLINRAITEKAVFLKLISSHPYATNGGSDEIGEIPAGTKYRVCMTVALWNKRYLRELLVRGESAWDIERFGSLRSAKTDSKFLSLSFITRANPPILDTHLIIKGRLLRDARDFLLKENLLNEMKRRKLQTLGSYVYVRLYLFSRDMGARLQQCIQKIAPRRISE